MEDHFILFPIMILLGIIYAIWYMIKLVWFLLGATVILIRRISSKKNNEASNNEIGVNNYVNR